MHAYKGHKIIITTHTMCNPWTSNPQHIILNELRNPDYYSVREMEVDILTDIFL